MVKFNDVEIANKGFLINIKEREDRLKESIDEFKKINITGVEVFNAVVDENPAFGCNWSHYGIMELQVKNGWEKIIIFEDDFMFDIMSNEVNDLDNEWIKSVVNSEYDVLFLGSTLTEKASYVGEFILQPKAFVQTTCYIITLQAAKQVLDLYRFWDESHILYSETIDTFFNILVKKTHWKEDKFEIGGLYDIKNNNFKIYFSNPIIFNQRPSFSNLRNQSVDYSYINKVRNIKYSNI